MTQYFLFVIYHNEYLKKLQNLAFGWDVDLMAWQHTDQHLHGRNLFSSNFMTRILND